MLFMQSQQLEAIAHKACFSIDQQERLSAGINFLNFIYSLKPENFQQIMSNFSPTVLFVFCQYANKYLVQYIQKGNKVRDIFMAVQKTTFKWFREDGHIIINQSQQQLQRYIQNSVSLLFGHIMKQMFSSPSDKKQFIQYLKQIERTAYKIYVYKSFIEVVSTIQTRLGFLIYRTLIYSFQQQIIPMITQELVPFFILVTQKIKVNQLSCMMPRLSQTQSRSPIILVRQQEKSITKMTFDLLKQVTNFSYNISFNEYDLETVYDNCLISFPQSLISKIISKQFLEALYFVIQKIINVGNKQNEYLTTCFECLKKILLTKTCLCNNQTIVTYIKINLKGLNSLFMNQKLAGPRLADLIECSQKFIVSIQINHLKPLQEQYLQWISNIKIRVVHILKHTSLNHENDILLESADLVLKLIGQSLSPFFKDDIHVFVDIATTFGLQFLNAFFQKNQNFMGDVKVLKLSHYKKVAQQFIRPFMLICSINTHLLVQKLYQICDSILQQQNILKISQYIILVSQVARQNFLERNILYDSEQKEGFIPLGGVIHKIYNFIDLYKSSNQRIEQLDVAIIIFMDSVLQQLLIGLQFQGDQIKLNNLVYYVIQTFKQIPSSDQMIALFHLKELINYLGTSSSVFSQFILDAIYKHLLRMKWGLRKQAFKYTESYKIVLQICINVSRNKLSSSLQQLKWRKQLFRVIGLLSFDDLQDSFKQNVNFILQMIQEDMKSQGYSKIVFDLTGVCQNIESPLIYRYFLTSLDKRIGIHNLMQKMFHSFAQNQVMLRHVLKFNTSMIKNKAHRFISKRILIKFYQCLNNMIPFWSTLLSSAVHQDWQDIVKQLYKIMIICLGQGHINIYLLRRNNTFLFQEFILNFMTNLAHSQSWVCDYPKISSRYLQLLTLISTNHLELILNYTNNSIIIQFNNIIDNVLTQIIFNLQQLFQGKKTAQKFLMPLLDFAKSIFYFCRKSKQIKHRPAQTQNVDFILNKSQNKIKFLEQLYKFGLGNGRNFTNMFNLTTSIIYEVSFLYPSSHESVFQNLNIVGKRVTDFQNIYKTLYSGKEDNGFVSNLKEWMQKCDTDCEPEIDY